MAYEVGTATDHEDLYSKVLSFLTTNTDLVTAGQNWTQVWAAPSGAENETDVVLQAPGSSGSEEIFLGFRLGGSAGDETLRIELSGMSGILDEATTFLEHINCTANSVVAFVADSAMSYWIVANGRRFILVVKVSTVYEMLYGGLILPYCLPTSYPYPLLVGGSGTAINTSAQTWRSTNAAHSMPYRAYVWGEAAGYPVQLMAPDGTWVPCMGVDSNTDQPGVIGPGQILQDSDYNIYTTLYVGAYVFLETIAAGFGGSFPLLAFEIRNRDDAVQYGAFDGLFFVPGNGNSAESVVTDSGTDYVCFQDVFRTDVDGYCALKME